MFRHVFNRCAGYLRVLLDVLCLFYFLVPPPAALNGVCSVASVFGLDEGEELEEGCRVTLLLRQNAMTIARW